jgi:hypothetical protein
MRSRAWNNATPITGHSPRAWRLDDYGNLMRRGSYGTRGLFAWRIVFDRHGADDRRQGAPRAQHIAVSCAAPAAERRSARAPAGRRVSGFASGFFWPVLPEGRRQGAEAKGARRKAAI